MKRFVLGLGFLSLAFVISFIPLLSGFSQNAYAQENQEVDLLFFYGRGCPHCSKAKTFLSDMSSKYPLLKISEYEIYFERENNKIFQELAEAYDSRVQGVPTIFIDNKIFVGFSNAIGESLKNEINRCFDNACENPLEKLDTGNVRDITKITGGSSPLDSPKQEAFKKKLTVPAVILAALVDAINPCAFAVLIILLTTVLASKNRKRSLWAGLAFTLSIYISYFLMGIGLYSAIQVTRFTHVFYIIVSVLAILIGLFNLKDYFAYGKWFIMEVPISWRPKMKSLIRGITSVPGAFLIGFAVSLFLLPCTSGPYIVILGLLASVTERNYAVTLLLLYNLIFVLPMLLITGAICLGLTTTEKAEEWRKKKLKILHLIAGLVILFLGIAMLIGLWLGYL